MRCMRYATSVSYAMSENPSYARMSENRMNGSRMNESRMSENRMSGKYARRAQPPRHRIPSP